VEVKVKWKFIFYQANVKQEKIFKWGDA